MADQEYLTLGEAAKLCPGRPSTNAIWRWCRRGVKARSGERVHLEHVRLGGRIFTSADAVHRFGVALADSDRAHFGTSGAHAIDTTRTDTQRQRAVDRAEADLAAAGI